MKRALAVGAALLVALLTWLLLRGIDTNASAYADAQRAFGDFALAETSIGRDVLQARSGLLGNYDVLVEAEAAMESAVSRLRSYVEAENLDPKPVERLAAAVGQYEGLIERFKSSNSLLQNSLSYVGQLSTDPAFGALGDQLAPSTTALAAAVLRLSRDSSAANAKSLQDQITRFEAQAPTGGPDGEVAHALLAHARLLSDRLPEIDQTLRGILAAPVQQPLEETRELMARAQADLEVTAQRFRVLLYVVSLGLLALALRLGLRLRTRTLRIRRLVEANIIGIFIWELDGRITEANDAFLHLVGRDRGDLASGGMHWNDLTPAEWRERDERALTELNSTRTVQPYEKEYFRKDRTRVPVLFGGALFEEGGNQGVAFVFDLTERKRAEERLHVQHTVARILAEAARIEEATPRILSAIGGCLGWDVGVLWRVDREAEALRCVELWHKASIDVREFERVSRESTFGPGLGLPGRVWSSLEPEYIPDVVPDENFPRAPIAELEGLRAAFGFPILLGGQVLGVIEFFSREIKQPDEALLNVLATIGSQIGQFIERIRGQEALRESEAKVRRLVDANIVGIFFWDFDGRILEANEAFLRIVGYDHEDLVAGRVRWTDLTPPEWRDRDAQLIQEHKVSGILQPFEKEYLRKDGSRIPVLIGVATFEGSGNQGVAFVIDLTERKQAEEALRRGEAWLAQAQRLSHIGTWVMNGTTRRFLYWSDESYRIWGLDPLRGLPSREDMWGRVHPDDRERVWGEVQEAMREQRDFFSEFRILLPDGTVKYLEANTRHEFSPLGALAEVICTSVDVTERERAQEEREKLRQLESDLAHMSRLSVMGELAASLAHEIAQPMGAAGNNARAAINFLDRSPLEPGEVREALACVVNNVDRAAEILDRIRDQIKKTPPRKGHVDLNQAITDVIALAQSAIIKNGVSVQTDLIDGLPHVQADRVQLQQVILNLILNAVEAMSAVDNWVRTLSVSTERHQSGGVLASVRDSGPGIDSEHLDRVFDPFYTTKSSGVGMGLSICRSIVRAHGGQLWADVNPSGGAVFRLILPSDKRNS